MTTTIKDSGATPDLDSLHLDLEHSREDYQHMLAFYSASGLVYTPESIAAKRRFVEHLEAELEDAINAQRKEN